MLTTSTLRAPEDILGALEFAPNPMYILSVRHPQDIRFLGANPAYAHATGLISGAIANKRPNEILPPRVADMALENIRACCTRGSNYTFEEILDLLSRRCWWLTSLAPISDANGIHTIVGSSVDISALKHAVANKSLEYQRLQRRANHWHDFVANAAEDARGPPSNILSLSRMLKYQQDPTEETGSIATLLEDTAARSLQQLNHQTKGVAVETTEREDSADFGQLCREFAAIADPQAKLEIVYPDCMYEVNEAIVRLLLNSLADQAAMHAATFIKINILPSPIEADTLRLILDFDTRPGSRVHLVHLGTICQAHGVKIRHVIHNEVHRVEFLLPIARPKANTIVARGSERNLASA